MEEEEGEWNDQALLDLNQRVWQATNFGQLAELEEILQKDDDGNLVEGVSRDDAIDDDEILVSLFEIIDTMSLYMQRCRMI